MKTKLLRKVRKRYSIYWYPERNVFELWDYDKSIYTQPLNKAVYKTKYECCYIDYEDITKEEAYKLVLGVLQRSITDTYWRYGVRRLFENQKVINKRFQKEKVWYV